MIETTLCDCANLAFADGVHRPEDRYRIALYTDDAELDHTTKAYTTQGEVVGAGYDAGGWPLLGRKVVLVDRVACFTFDNIRKKRCTIEASGAMIYNASKNNAAIAVLSFGSPYRSTNGDFELNFPAATPNAAIIAIG